MFEAAPDGIVVVDARGTITLVNRQIEELFGYQREELLGERIELLVPERYRDVHPHHRGAYFKDARTRPMGAGLQLSARRKDGSEFPADISLSAIETEEGMSVLAAIRDITERRIVEERLRIAERRLTRAALQASEERFRILVEGVNDYAMYMLDPSGKIVSWNAGAERIKGYRAEEVIGRQSEIFYRPEDIAAGVPVRELEIAESEGRFSAQAWRVRKDGSHFLAEVVVAALRDDEDRLRGFSKITRDVSERVTAQRERERLEAQLNQSRRLESLGQLAGGIAHDFNNLLAVIINYADFAAGQVTEDEALESDISEIRTAAQRASDLTRQLLIFSRKERVKPTVFDVNDTVRGVERLLKRTLGEFIQLEIDLEPVSPVKADESQMEQVLLNLAVNARDAMREGGRLTIETSEAYVDPTESWGRTDLPPGSYDLVQVRDTGTGMEEDVVMRAFEPFFTTKPAGEGTGLGLATVYGIITKAGGHVTIDSEMGEGTTVKAYLPAFVGDVAAEDEPEEPQPDRGQGRILVVEDEDGVRELTRRILSRQGYEVITAANGAEALVRAEEVVNVDLLLTDVIMPHMSGKELADRLKHRHPDLSILFMSGYTQDVLGSEPLEAPLIEKPFTVEKLLGAVTEVLDSRP